ncbi:DUF202 domain-containing protein [Reyranella sp.]|uniref:DUF202 domain-containing protein n=1 Tax=Reyranella sp. TaxID=1929291 RepID=UPI003D0972B7
MTDLRAEPRSDRSAANVTTGSHFSWLQTQLALENTMLAWIHTTVTTIGFGSAIVQLYEHLHDLPGGTSGLLASECTRRSTRWRWF